MDGKIGAALGTRDYRRSSFASTRLSCLSLLPIHFFGVTNFGRKGTSLPEQIQLVSDNLRRWYAANPAVHRTQKHALFGPSASQCRHPEAETQSSRELIFGALPR